MRFHKDIYSKIAIEKALKAFDRLAKFSLKEEGSYFVLEQKSSVEYDKFIEKEFSNYVLELAINDKKK